MTPHPQPARGVIAMRRLSIRAVAKQIGHNEHWVGRVLNGYGRPSPEFRRALSELLGVPESELFHDEFEPRPHFPGNRALEAAS